MRNRIGTGRSGRRGLGLEQLDLGGTRRAVAQHDPAPERLEGLGIGNPLDLDEIRPGVLVPRVGEPVGQRAVVGQEEQPFAVAIEPADRVDARDAHEVLEGRPALGVGELAEDVVGLEEGEVAVPAGRTAHRIHGI